MSSSSRTNDPGCSLDIQTVLLVKNKTFAIREGKRTSTTYKIKRIDAFVEITFWHFEICVVVHSAVSSSLFFLGNTCPHTCHHLSSFIFPSLWKYFSKRRNVSHVTLLWWLMQLLTLTIKSDSLQLIEVIELGILLHTFNEWWWSRNCSYSECHPDHFFSDSLLFHTAIVL